MCLEWTNLVLQKEPKNGGELRTKGPDVLCGSQAVETKV